jgi:glyoxylase-like metal-dependent hydrolase (beta-lactamase superfamily II)
MKVEKTIVFLPGDTLFVGDVGGRIWPKGDDLTMFELAGKLFDSIQSKLLPIGR